MPRSPKRSEAATVADQVLEAPESSVLDLLDSLLNKGVMVNGDVTLGVAGIDQSCTKEYGGHGPLSVNP